MKHTPACNHIFEDINEFRTVEGAKYLQQRCKKCGVTNYVQLELPHKNDQNDSKKEEET